MMHKTVLTVMLLVIKVIMIVRTMTMTMTMIIKMKSLKTILIAKLTTIVSLLQYIALISKGVR